MFLFALWQKGDEDGWMAAKSPVGQHYNIVIYSQTWKDINLARRAGGQYLPPAPFFKYTNTKTHQHGTRQSFILSTRVKSSIHSVTHTATGKFWPCPRTLLHRLFNLLFVITLPKLNFKMLDIFQKEKQKKENTHHRYFCEISMENLAKFQISISWLGKSWEPVCGRGDVNLGWHEYMRLRRGRFLLTFDIYSLFLNFRLNSSLIHNWLIAIKCKEFLKTNGHIWSLFSIGTWEENIESLATPFGWWKPRIYDMHMITWWAQIWAHRAWIFILGTSPTVSDITKIKKLAKLW